MALVKKLANGEDPLPGVESDEALFVKNVSESQKVLKALQDHEAQEALEVEKRRVEEKLTKKAQELFDGLSVEQRLELVREQPMAKLNSTAHNALIMAKLKEQVARD